MSVVLVVPAPHAGSGTRRFSVTVVEGDSETRHETTLRETDLRRFAEDASAETFVTAAFRFLLDREPKEAILAHFDISVIARYFPEFDREIRGYLSTSARG